MCKTTPVLRVLTPTPPHNHFFICKPRPGVIIPGEPHRRDHHLPLYLLLCLLQNRRLYRRHRKQRPREPIATPCSPVLRGLLHAAKSFHLPPLSQGKAHRVKIIFRPRVGHKRHHCCSLRQDARPTRRRSDYSPQQIKSLGAHQQN